MTSSISDPEPLDVMEPLNVMEPLDVMEPPDVMEPLDVVNYLESTMLFGDRGMELVKQNQNVFKNRYSKNSSNILFGFVNILAHKGVHFPLEEIAIDRLSDTEKTDLIGGLINGYFHVMDTPVIEKKGSRPEKCLYCVCGFLVPIWDIIMFLFR